MISVSDRDSVQDYSVLFFQHFWELLWLCKALEKPSPLESTDNLTIVCNRLLYGFFSGINIQLLYYSIQKAFHCLLD